ncbi:hypothetical protein KPSA3_02133 [Pseudomonas syringae pv. actinidiae]|uniref:Uncharacterized protein n=1 Tax=Pseudomonas syringae pv. actinidiae TaxID=103796 RepID=A0AAN4Q3U5_PSESF|nr:hypothetical protein KPSA3_02133 [Pseudomonas syringae pv. actinidiae]
MNSKLDDSHAAVILSVIFYVVMHLKIARQESGGIVTFSIRQRRLND